MVGIAALVTFHEMERSERKRDEAEIDTTGAVPYVCTPQTQKREQAIAGELLLGRGRLSARRASVFCELLSRPAGPGNQGGRDTRRAQVGRGVWGRRPNTRPREAWLSAPSVAVIPHAISLRDSRPGCSRRCTLTLVVDLASIMDPTRNQNGPEGLSLW